MSMKETCSVVVMLISIWLTIQKVESQTGHEDGLPSGMQSGGSQMTTGPRESTSITKSIQLR